MLELGILNNAGFTVITGEIGSGKTTLVRYLLKRIDPHIAVGLISNTPQAPTWRSIALFQDFQHAQYANRYRTTITIDEAQNLTADALEGLRMLSNVYADKDQLLQLILVGQPQLRDVLSALSMLQFAQRISSEFHLKALSANEVSQYIDHRLQSADAKAPLSSRAACDMIALVSGGVPRPISILCDIALVYGFASGANLAPMHWWENCWNGRGRSGCSGDRDFSILGRS